METQEERRPLSLRRRIAYGLIVACISATLFLGLLEGGLRLIGIGHPTDYYREVRAADGTPVYRENRWFVAPYFSAELVRRPQPMRLPVHKELGAYRVFVLGSSAAMGDPEASYSLSRTLQEMLETAYPDVQFEVVNAAITAINSHVVRQAAADLADLEPDLYIVYEGNNEVIGPFGPAAVFTPFMASPTAIRLTVALRQTRTGQVIMALAHALGRDGSTVAEWGGMQLFLDQQFRRDDPRLDRVADLFAGNLRAIVRSGQSAGARTLLCTVLTNQRDFAPFLSSNNPGLLPEQLAAWEAAVAAGDAALAGGDSQAAAARYAEAWAIDPTHAGLAFRMGRTALASGDTTAGAHLLQTALDLDTLRFRTDSRLNQVIRDVAGEQDAATLVDIAATVAARSPFGSPGDEFLYEHVHLNLRGTYEVAQALYERVGDDLLARGRINAKAPQPLSYDDIRLRLAYTPYDQAMIIHGLLGRFTAPPFTGQMDNPARVAKWEQRRAAADGFLDQPGAADAVIAFYEQAIAANPGDWVLQRNFGMALVALGHPARAVEWLEKADGWIDDDPDTLFALATAYQALSREADAAATFARLRKLEPRYPGMKDEG